MASRPCILPVHVFFPCRIRSRNPGTKHVNSRTHTHTHKRTHQTGTTPAAVTQGTPPATGAAARAEPARTPVKTTTTATPPPRPAPAVARAATGTARARRREESQQQPQRSADRDLPLTPEIIRGRAVPERPRDRKKGRQAAAVATGEASEANNKTGRRRRRGGGGGAASPPRTRRSPCLGGRTTSIFRAWRTRASARAWATTGGRSPRARTSGPTSRRRRCSRPGSTSSCTRCVGFAPLLPPPCGRGQGCAREEQESLRFFCFPIVFCLRGPLSRPSRHHSQGRRWNLCMLEFLLTPVSSIRFV